MNRRFASIGVLVALLISLPGVLGCSDCDLKITTGELPEGTVGVAYSVDLDSDCGGDTWFLQAGNLPPGIGLLEDGELRGTPTRVGSYVFTLGVVDDDSWEVAFKGFELFVNDMENPP